MMQDRDDKYESPEESEYHFSDEDATYEVESDHPKAAPMGGVARSPLARLSSPKRMAISAFVFLGLVYVAYKLVAPSSSEPVVTDVAQNIPAAHATSKPAVVANANQPAETIAPKPEAITASPTAAAMPPVTGTPVAENAAPPATPAYGAAPMTNTPVAANDQPAFAPAAPISALPPSAIPSASVAPVTTVAVTQPEQVLSATPTSLPGVIPIQAPPITATPVASPTSTASPVDLKIAAVAMQNDRAIGQIQTEYTQKINEFSAQNKILQDQMQSLTNRMATIEVELNRLVQTLTQKQEAQSPFAPAAPQPSSPPSSMQSQMQLPSYNPNTAMPRITYNVQAIIPGRAWLRSENGETITVAEGDVIKDLGRITKIDPYDGVVEINTGSKTLSLSYGTQAS